MKVDLVSARVRTSPKNGQVIPRDLPTSEAGRALEADFSRRRTLRVPRGGVASFQVVVTTEAPGDGAEIELHVGPFAKGSDTLPEASVCYEWPCQLAEDEWTYEGLIPVEVYRAAPAEVRQGPLGSRSHHALWVDVPVPREAEAGTYRGGLRVDGAEAGEIAVEVLPVELPLVPGITVDLNSYANHIPGHHPGLTGDELIACEHSYYREAHDNRAVLHYLGYGHSGALADGYAPPLAGRGRNLRVADWSAYDRRFGPLLDGSALAGSPGGERPIPHFYLPFNYDWPADFAHFGTPGYDLEFAQVLAQFRLHAQEKGWTRTNFEVFFNQKKRYRYYAWDGDERKQEADRDHFLYYRDLIDRGARLAGEAGARARFIYRTDASWAFAHDAPHDQIGPVFDLWVIGLGNFTWTRFGVEAIKARGQLAWWYGGCGGPEQPTMDADRQAVLCWRRGGDGFLPTWLTMAGDSALDRADPLSMLYPGRRFGYPRALGSIRLRSVRSATETTDCLEMLGEGGRKLVDELAEARDDDWWTPTPSWALWPPEVMTNEMYGQQPLANPLAKRDPHTPAVIRERALAALLGE